MQCKLFCTRGDFKLKIAIMQPYFFPYIGYWQLINAVDEFVIYDNIQYTKKGWINRNRFLLNGKDEIFSIPLKKDSDYKNVIERNISPTFDKKGLISKFQNAYFKAPFKKEITPLLEKIIYYENDNLFEYVYNSVLEICNYLEIKTNIIVSSKINIDHSLKSKDKVIAIVKALNGSKYINPIGGVELYDKKEFENNNISLEFLRANEIKYNQNTSNFIPNLSIVDLLMYNDLKKVQDYLKDYTLI